MAKIHLWFQIWLILFPLGNLPPHKNEGGYIFQFPRIFFLSRVILKVLEYELEMSNLHKVGKKKRNSVSQTSKDKRYNVPTFRRPRDAIIEGSNVRKLLHASS